MLCKKYLHKSRQAKNKSWGREMARECSMFQRTSNSERWFKRAILPIYFAKDPMFLFLGENRIRRELLRR